MSVEVPALVFDAYGTLFDVHSVAQRAEELFPGKGAAISAAWRAKQLEYTWLRTLMGRYEDFNGVTRAVAGFVSSNGWDAAGARAFGFRAYWVNRTGAPVERLGVRPDAVVKDLTELAVLLD